MSCESSPVPKTSKNKEYKKMKENRKIPKPLIERNRRARINRSLQELEKLLVEEIQVEAKNRKNGKLEKADILEIAVNKMKGLKSMTNIIVVGNQPWRPWLTQHGLNMTDYNNNEM